MEILVTGGLGYIGSHTVVELINEGYEPIIIDNLSNADISMLERIEKITGKKPTFYQIEMCDKPSLQQVFDKHPNLTGVIHFAAVLFVDESVSNPLKYYHNNLSSTIHLLECMADKGINNIVFSSSCTVYGNPDSLPVNENAPIKPAQSPYGNTKKMCEEILQDTSKAHPLKVISLRYFNPIGAHKSGLIGEIPHGVPTHLVPYITETASGKRKELRIFGHDYQTPDGTCVRDYIHVVDIALAHIKAMERMIENKSSDSFEIFNIGSGSGYSVLEMVKSFEKATGIAINYSLVDRRPGDVEAVYADTSKALKGLNWKAEISLEEMLRSAWEWQKVLDHESE
jgi:UDP-glucose 4-epimerase